MFDDRVVFVFTRWAFGCHVLNSGGPHIALDFVHSQYVYVETYA
jgi:hypothetical protein